MENVSNKLFLCYAWEDLHEINTVAADIQYELDIKVDVPSLDESMDVEEQVFPLIDEAEVVLVFVSEMSKNSILVKKCVKYSLNLNKRLLPVEIGKSGLFSTMPPEFKFRVKSTLYSDADQRSNLFSQLKAILGIDVENGDSYGTLVHLTVDANVSVWRYGKKLCDATPENDNKIRLAKGEHKIDFKSLEFSSVSESLTIEIQGNDGETFRDVKIAQRLKDLRDEFEKQELAEQMRKQVQAEQLKKQIEEEQELKRILEEESKAAHSSVALKVQNHIAHELNCNPSEVSLDKKLIDLPFEEDDFDYLDENEAKDLHVVEIIMSIEKEFGISIPDSVAEKFKTVGDVVSFIEKEPKKTSPSVARINQPASVSRPKPKTNNKVQKNSSSTSGTDSAGCSVWLWFIVLFFVGFWILSLL